MRRKKSDLTKKKEKLWKLFSKFIRERDNYTCITCGKQQRGSGMHAGHFIPSSICGIGLRYDEDNVHAQCYACNINKSGNYVTYREILVNRHGEEWVRNLEQRRHEIIEDFNYEEAIKKYERMD
jgi:5-methylcytosine-specific restriction endonuclease McrA